METTIESATRTRESTPSSWVDPATHVRETAMFFGGRGERAFGCLYEPSGDPRAGIVICCPYQAEMLRNYRREVLLARALAAQGIAVQRFHYRGSGHSEGETAGATFDSMVEDALDARELLASKTGVTDAGFVGARLGGLIAAAAAARTQASLGLWEPVSRPERYFDEILRFRLVREIQGDGKALTAENMLSEMREKGSVDILGHTLERALFDSTIDQNLASVITASIPSILLLQMAPGRTLRREYQALADAWRTAGIDVETGLVVDREAWWLSGDMWPVHETHPPTMALISATVSWVLRSKTPEVLGS